MMFESPVRSKDTLSKRSELRRRSSLDPGILIYSLRKPYVLSGTRCCEPNKRMKWAATLHSIVQYLSAPHIAESSTILTADCQHLTSRLLFHQALNLAIRLGNSVQHHFEHSRGFLLLFKRCVSQAPKRRKNQKLHKWCWQWALALSLLLFHLLLQISSHKSLFKTDAVEAGLVGCQFLKGHVSFWLGL